MSLLQISEPGASPDPHQRRIAVGIDLGTTHSLVAAVRHGVSECLPDGQGRVILPSVVRYLGEGRRQIGHDAQSAQAEDRENHPSSMAYGGGGRYRQPRKAAYRFVAEPGMVNC